MSRISARADVDPGAVIGEDVEVGPFCVVGGGVMIGEGCRLMNGVTVLGRTTVGRGNVFFPNAVIGASPQDKKYKGESTELIIGDGNVFREGVTVHLGTERAGGVTSIGDHGMFMVNAHVGHDTRVGNHVVIGSNVVIAGNVHCHDRVAVMTGAGVFHYVTLAAFTYVGAYARIRRDTPPYLKVDGADEVRGVNKVGLRRAGYGDVEVEAVETAYFILFKQSRPLAEAIAEVERRGLDSVGCVGRLLEFMRRRVGPVGE